MIDPNWTVEQIKNLEAEIERLRAALRVARDWIEWTELEAEASAVVRKIDAALEPKVTK